jgi:hypothetical protein
MPQTALTPPMYLQAQAVTWDLTRVLLNVPGLTVALTVTYYDADGLVVGNTTINESIVEMAGSEAFGTLQTWFLEKLTARGAIN